MKVRIEDVPRGINIALKCCEEGRFRVKGSILDPNKPYFIASEETEEEYTFCCCRCKKSCSVIYADGFYCIRMPESFFTYNGDQICLSGKCACGNNPMCDNYTNEKLPEHCVPSHEEGEYSFDCPCSKTTLRVLVRAKDNHFHVCRIGDCPALTAEGKEVDKN